MHAGKALMVKPYNALADTAGHENEVPVGVVVARDDEYGLA